MATCARESISRRDIAVRSEPQKEHLRIVGGSTCYFFFQAEDGIRALYVTGVQTCALPISAGDRPSGDGRARWSPAAGSHRAGAREVAGSGRRGKVLATQDNPGRRNVPRRRG